MELMQPWLHLKLADLVAQRPADAGADIHLTESLAETVVREYTTPGQSVLDPFAGYGTALTVAQRLGRHPIGVELVPERVALIRQRLSGDAEVISGDARNLAALVSGPVDLCFTSPPYMTAVDHPENPLTAYRTRDGDYATYLTELGDVFRQVATLLRPGGHAVINVANIRTAGGITPLAWDVAGVVARHLTLRHEAFLCWDEQPTGISGDYCFVFQRTGRPADAPDARPSG